MRFDSHSRWWRRTLSRVDALRAGNRSWSGTICWQSTNSGMSTVSSVHNVICRSTHNLPASRRTGTSIVKRITTGKQVGEAKTASVITSQVWWRWSNRRAFFFTWRNGTHKVQSISKTNSVCLSVNYRRPNGWAEHYPIWHTHICI